MTDWKIITYILGRILRKAEMSETFKIGKVFKFPTGVVTENRYTESDGSIKQF